MENIDSLEEMMRTIDKEEREVLKSTREKHSLI